MRAPEPSIKNKFLESWIRDAACFIRGAKEPDWALRKILKQLGIGYGL